MASTAILAHDMPSSPVNTGATQAMSYRTITR